jgi:NADPH:quinone reductase-like Zn-dependent oxidoreductase
VANDRNEIAQALWYVAVGRAELREEELLLPAPGMVRVRALHGALSRGTEALVFAGRVPLSEFERMRAPFMGGVFPFPVKYGYSVVGRVEAGPAELRDRLVFALHPHQTRFAIPASAAVPLPEGLPPTRAVLAANMETALNAVWDAEPKPGDRIAIVGAGVVGALVGYLSRRTIPDVDVTLVDINPARAEIARALNLKFAAPEAAPAECDLVVHTSASAAGLATAFNLARDEATVLELSWYGAGDVAVPLGGAFHSRRLRLISSQVGKVAPSHRASWTHRARLEAALAYIADPRLDALIAPAVPFSDLPARLPQILAPASCVLCQRIDYP